MWLLAPSAGKYLEIPLMAPFGGVPATIRPAGGPFKIGSLGVWLVRFIRLEATAFKPNNPTPKCIFSIIPRPPVCPFLCPFGIKWFICHTYMHVCVCLQFMHLKLYVKYYARIFVYTRTFYPCMCMYMYVWMYFCTYAYVYMCMCNFSSNSWMVHRN